MGHSIHYKTNIARWKDFEKLVERIAYGIGYEVEVGKNYLVLDPGHPLVEPLIIEKKRDGLCQDQPGRAPPFHIPAGSSLGCVFRLR
ncbi:hypothetical protein [Thermococcus sp.]|uniref:hypothetical protein n=1 Tax=Thermococcus sp. TaxID=35749 RepID=UPI00262AF664|nr:hypothetical protein [Thermococcus sp.]